MKAIKTILFVAAISTLVVSCKKERTCDCKYTNTEVTTSGGLSATTISNSTNVTVAEKLSKKDGRRYLDCFNSTKKYTTISNSGGSTFVTEHTDEQSCTLK